MGFLLEYVKRPLSVGAIAPSSRFLAEKMLAPVDFSSANTIIELGAGTGVFTTRILDRMRDDATLHAFEINDAFLARLRGITDARLRVLNKPAEELGRHVSKADAIISALPLMAFPQKTVQRIINEIKNALKPDGVYVQFQYALKSKALMERHFRNVSVSFTPFNLPPAFVYACRK